MKKAVPLAALLLAAIATPASAQNRAATLSEAAWLSPDADVVAFLTETPGECAMIPGGKDARYAFELGRVAFRSPFLLGGQAARGKLACATCHRDGRGNPDFFYEGLSGAPGTADVTSSLFSTVRDDGAFNPRPIPDLADVAGKPQFGSAHPFDTLEGFVGAAVTDEFQGAPPSAAVLEGLVAYVASLRSDACPDEASQAAPRRSMKDVLRAMRVADLALARNDLSAADFALLSAQGELGRVAERFAAQPREAGAIAALSREIGKTRAIAAGAPRGARVRLEEFDLAARRLGWRLDAARRGSLYDPATIAEIAARGDR